MRLAQRKARVSRRTRETSVEVELDLDGSGYEVSTPYAILTHLLESMAHHGGIGLRVEASGDMAHHVFEDTGIALGEALDRALGDRAGVRRFGYAVVPMDEALVLVSLDLVRRPRPVIDLRLRGSMLEGVDGGLVEHMLESFATWGRFTLHVLRLRGEDSHHVAEAVFKALGLALRDASRLEERGGVPSTKGEM